MNECKENKKKKCAFKCSTCHNYDRNLDFCLEKNIEECSKQSHINFSSCEDYLIRENLVMF